MFHLLTACLTDTKGSNCELCVHCKHGSGTWCHDDGVCQYGCVGGWTQEKCDCKYKYKETGMEHGVTMMATVNMDVLVLIVIPSTEGFLNFICSYLTCVLST